MKAKEFYGFSGWSADDELDYNTVARNFQTDPGPEPELVYAVYSTPAYEGSADVIFRRDGEWFHVNGGHCSCYGLEKQWEPKPLDTETFFKAEADGRSYLLPYDSEGDYPEATKEHFSEWLKWAVAQPR